MARCVKRVVELGRLARVVEFGNQRYGAMNVIPGSGHVKTVEEFYRWLGFSEYWALDVNTAMGAIVADLNVIDDSLYARVGQFDLVTNNGTGEHVFDQAAVLANAHNLCKTGGVMLHVLPFSPWINHGFFNYNPILFRDLAAVNGYEILFIVIGHRNDGVVEVPRKEWEWLFAEKSPGRLLHHMEAMRKRPGAIDDNLLIGVAMCKRSDAPFRKPLQGKYQKDVESVSLRGKYQTRGP